MTTSKPFFLHSTAQAIPPIPAPTITILSGVVGLSRVIFEKRESGEGDGVVFRLWSGANCRVPWIVGLADRFGKYICGPGVAIGQISAE